MSSAPEKPAGSPRPPGRDDPGSRRAGSAADPNPSDPFRGLYVSDDLAVTLARTSAETLDARLDAAARCSA